MRPSVQPKLIGQQSLLTLLSLFLRDLRYLLFKLFSAKFPSFRNWMTGPDPLVDSGSHRFDPERGADP